ncbi:MAG: tetratricopeptide repeat protein [Desulfobacca sp.]|uniref:tetratricopeptide repeat protein n=1 Tax=Desulfobacca sp. TaxID=2067990 RepID=UPI00404AB20D
MRSLASPLLMRLLGTRRQDSFSFCPFPFSLAGGRSLCWALLLPLLLSACLTTQGRKKAPTLRGISAREAERLETLHNPEWRQPRPQPSQEETPENLAATAELLLQRGDYEQSLYTLSKILHQAPQRHDIRYKLGLALLMTGRLEDAKRELAEVLVYRDLPEAHEALGAIHLQEDKPAEAQEELRAALAQAPQRIQARVLLGEAYLRGGQYTQALAELKAALAQAPRNARILGNIGWVHYKMKQYDEALRWLQQAKTISPKNPRINQRLGMVLAAQKKYPQALEAFRQGGDEALAFNNIGVYYYLDGRYEEAARCFQKALDLRPTYYEEAKLNLDKTLARLQGDHAAGAPVASVPDQPARRLQAKE